MSIKEQKFSALDSFVEKGFEIVFYLDRKNYGICIYKLGKNLFDESFKDADEAMTYALRYLRKINKPKP